MARGFDLELMRKMLADNAVHLTLGMITKLEVADDRSVMRVQVKTFPDMNEIVAMMTWEHVGPSSGIFAFPALNDMVLVAFADKDPDSAFVLKRLTSKEDQIPLQAMDGSTVIKSINGKKNHILSNTAIFLGRGGSADPTEPLVLGNVFTTAYSHDLQQTAIHKHIGNLGYFTAVPDNAQEFLDLKASPVDDKAILSDLSKTEK